MAPECKGLGLWKCLQNEGLYLYFFQKLSLYCTQTSFREFYWDGTFKPSLLGDVSNEIVSSTLILPAVPLCMVIALIYLVAVCFLQDLLACSMLMALRLNQGCVVDGAVVYQTHAWAVTGTSWPRSCSACPVGQRCWVSSSCQWKLLLLLALWGWVSTVVSRGARVSISSTLIS